MNGGILDQNGFAIPFWLIGKALQAAKPGPDQSQQRAHALNEQGVAAYNAKAYGKAAMLFREALALSPNDAVIRRNLGNAKAQEGERAFARFDYPRAMHFFQEALQFLPAGDPNIALVRNSVAQTQAMIDQAQAQARQQAENHQQDVAAAASMRQTLQGMTQAAGAGTGGQLGFMAADASPAQGAGRGVFGDRQANPTLTPASPPASQGMDTRAGDQVKSAAAAAAGGDHADLDPNYTGGAGYAGSLSVAAKAMGQTPGAAEFTSHIPEAARSDPQIQQNLAYYQKLDALKTDAEAQLSVVKQKLASGDGDPKLLNMQGDMLKTAIDGYSKDQATTTAQVQKQLTTIGIAWLETPPPAPGAASATPPQASK